MSKGRGDPSAVVPDVTPRSYYDQPVLKAPVWTVEIPWYLFTGGLAGASSVLAVVARGAGNDALARAAGRGALVGTIVSPVLLVSDLGMPSRFYNMLRVFKPTSPMSVGSWILAVYAPAAVGAAVLDELDRLPAARRLASAVAATLGPALATYTAVLLTNTAVPLWHEARREMPAAFAAGALQSAAAFAVATVDPADAGTARILLVAGVGARETAMRRMEHRLGDLGTPLRTGRPGRFGRASTVLSATAGAVAVTAGRRRRGAAVVAGVLGLAGAACERFNVFEAGKASALDPQATIGPQRARTSASSDATRG